MVLVLIIVLKELSSIPLGEVTKQRGENAASENKVKTRQPYVNKKRLEVVEQITVDRRSTTTSTIFFSLLIT